MKARILMAALTLTTIDAHAALYDRGNGMIYDSTQNITWLQDMNYASTSGAATDSYSGMSWSDANTWAANLNYGGYQGWHLPSAHLIGNTNFSNDGSTDVGYNNTRSDIGHLFSIDLNNMGGSRDLDPSIYGLNNITFIDAATGLTDSFVNMSDSQFWMADAGDSRAWIFDAWDGFQYPNMHISPDEEIHTTIVVHDGDVAAVPVPAAAWLFGSGLIGLAGAARKRKAV